MLTRKVTVFITSTTLSQQYSLQAGVELGASELPWDTIREYSGESEENL
jgi:hypothetical protein